VNKLNCPICNNPIVGRADKKYCSDQCRYLANNKNKFQAEWPILDINKTLRKNRSILKALCPVGKATVRRDVLDAMGYDLRVFSSLFLTSKKQIYYVCYDFAFTPILDNNVEKALIVTKQDYMNAWDPWKYVKNNS
jgi:predicted nucleic acid-binding Zn ribbon protein